MGLTDKQQALFMLLIFIIPSVIAWLSSPDPLTDSMGLRMLFAAVLSGILAFLKEYLGWSES